MKRINAKTVQFTDAEQRVKDWFDQHLDTDDATIGIEATARHALAALPTPDKGFVEYLSDGMLTTDKDGFVIPVPATKG